MGLIGHTSTAFNFFTFVFFAGGIVAVSTLAVAIVLLSNFSLNTFNRVYSPTVTNDALLRIQNDGTHYYRICNGSVSWECIPCGTITPSIEQSVAGPSGSGGDENPGSKLGTTTTDVPPSMSQNDNTNVQIQNRYAIELDSTFKPRDPNNSPKDCTCVSYDWRDCPIDASFKSNCPELSKRAEKLAEVNLAGGIIGIITFVFGFVLIVVVFKGWGVEKFEDRVLLGSVLAMFPFALGSLICFILGVVRIYDILDCKDCCSSGTTDPVYGTSLADQGFAFQGAVRNSYFVGLAFNAVFILIGIFLLLIGVDYRVACSCCFGRKKGSGGGSKSHQYLEKNKS